MKLDPTNHPIFSLDTDLGSSLLQLTDTPEAPLEIRNQPISFSEIPPPTTSLWKMFFDGASSREGAGAEWFLCHRVKKPYPCHTS
jgi:hypothetical protein